MCDCMYRYVICVCVHDCEIVCDVCMCVICDCVHDCIDVTLYGDCVYVMCA